MSASLSRTEIESALADLPGWTFEQDALTKTLTFSSFREAMGFMVRAAFEAEAMDHHPDWTNVYDQVAIRLSTHDAGNKVTNKDVELATRLQKISWVG